MAPKVLGRHSFLPVGEIDVFLLTAGVCVKGIGGTDEGVGGRRKQSPFTDSWPFLPEHKVCPLPCLSFLGSLISRQSQGKWPGSVASNSQVSGGKTTAQRFSLMQCPTGCRLSPGPMNSKDWKAIGSFCHNTENSLSRFPLLPRSRTVEPGCAMRVCWWWRWIDSVDQQPLEYSEWHFFF